MEFSETERRIKKKECMSLNSSRSDTFTHILITFGYYVVRCVTQHLHYCHIFVICLKFQLANHSDVMLCATVS